MAEATTLDDIVADRPAGLAGKPPGPPRLKKNESTWLKNKITECRSNRINYRELTGPFKEAFPNCQWNRIA